VNEQDQLSILKEGVQYWNSWRERNKDVQPFLMGADLRKLSLKGVNFQNSNLNSAQLSNTDLSNADFSEASLNQADLHQANLTGANFSKAILNRAVLIQTNLTEVNLSKSSLASTDFYEANLTDANMSGAILLDANLTCANLTRVNLTDAFLVQTRLIETNLSEAKLQGCWIYGVSVWNVNLTGAIQHDLRIAANKDDPIITIDNIEVAQFIFLILNNKKIRDVIDTITSKMVLILGRFTPDRKIVLDEIRGLLRENNYLPVMFDFKEPTNRDIVETVSTLAHMARFIIADITDAAMVREELEMITKDLPKIPIQPIILTSKKPYVSFKHIQKFPGVLEIYHYDSLTDLKNNFSEKIINPPELFIKDQNERNN
jgi:uncharacterized protein YjbI with pentapeptide repeats